MEESIVEVQDLSASFWSKYRVFDEVPFAVMVLKGPGLTIEYINRYVLNLWRLNLKDVLGKSLADAVPAVYAQVERMHQMVLRSGKRFAVNEFPIISYVDGVAETHYSNASIDPIYSEDNNNTMVAQLATFVDVTEQVKARQKAEISESYFKKMADTMPATVWITDKEGKCLYVNKRWYEMTGETEEDTLDTDGYGPVHPEDRNRVAAAFQYAAEKATGLSILYRLHKKGAGYRWVVDSGEPRFDADGNFEGHIGTVMDVHEQIMASKRMQDAQEIFRIAVEAAELGTYDYYPQSGRLFWNTKTRELFGLAPDVAPDIELCMQAVHPEDKWMATGVVQEALLTGNCYHENEVRIIRYSDHQTRWIRSKGKITFDSKHRPVRLTGVLQDITESKYAEDALRASEERYQHYIRQSTEGIFRMESMQPVPIDLPEDEQIALIMEKTFLAECNDALARKYGFNRSEELIGHSLQELYHAVKVRDAEKMLQQFIRGGYRLQDAETHETDNHGNERYFLNNLVGVIENGSLVRTWGSQRDVTHRRLAEKALHRAQLESESRKRLYETITSSTPDLICVLDLRYRFTYANEAFLKLLNRSWDEIQGRTLRAVGYSERQAIVHEREIDEVIATRKPFRGEVTSVSGQSGQRTYDYIFAPVMNEKGTEEAIAVTVRDITAMKAAQEVLTQSRERLEALVVERTRELQRSNEDLQQFAHVASHDLKEPVRKVMTFSNRLHDELGASLSEKAKLYLTKIERAAIRMYSMIDGVLLYSSLNALEQTMEHIQLEELISSIAADLEVLITQKNATLTHGSLSGITGSAILIYQLFYNLINNSLKFSRQDTPPVIHIVEEAVHPADLQQHQLDTSRKYKKIVVTDNGIGFTPGEARIIFSAFTRLHSRDRYEGTGLGLALCKKIAERHGGAISATGRENEGAVFTILLPV